ncbi:MAG TPA: hypothetical protein DCX37_02355 [Firmicutes bacterium]|jgi:hypothetical protein|nr:hypothetical protein [Bacillota bacterium]HAW70012.1 hypothetical protein [Bacillota bacterium]HBL49509.1 hypothetical protein [Bacillota bacterium]HBR24953.1 hypothetical protein [Bacillota bacterium]HCF93364.1 hypothetical protein [Bacillota bacterium]
MKNKKVIVAIITISLLSLAASVLANPLIEVQIEEQVQAPQDPRAAASAIERVEVLGKITQVTYGDNKKISEIFVVADVADRGSYDQANVIIDGNTKIYKGYTDQELKASDLKEGTTVAVAFTDDPRIMIYPPSAKARTIRVMDMDAQEQAAEQAQELEKKQQANAIIYENSAYGFSFALPAGWEGYRIVAEQWEGLSLENRPSGPILNIRHPQWTAEKPRQDIPIMIFTMAQWEALQSEKFHIGAAPMGPKELGRNSKYVFALPARYNYAFPEGFEEVDAILESGALKAY